MEDANGQDNYEDYVAASIAPEKAAGAITASEQARITRVIEAKREHGLPKLTRLTSKANAKATEYSDTRLVPSQELKRLNSIKLEVTKKIQKVTNAAKSLAVATVKQNPEIARGEGHEAGAAVQEGSAPHPSHDMRSFASADGLIIFCNECGKWQSHNAGRSKLKGRCETIPEGTKSQRKLLRHGIVPGKGAVLPASVKTSGGKKC